MRFGTLLRSLRPRRRRRALGGFVCVSPRYIAVEPGLLDDPTALRAVLEALAAPSDTRPA